MKRAAFAVPALVLAGALLGCAHGRPPLPPAPERMPQAERAVRASLAVTAETELQEYGNPSGTFRVSGALSKRLVDAIAASGQFDEVRAGGKGALTLEAKFSSDYDTHFGLQLAHFLSGMFTLCDFGMCGLWTTPIDHIVTIEATVRRNGNAVASFSEKQVSTSRVGDISQNGFEPSGWKMEGHRSAVDNAIAKLVADLVAKTDALAAAARAGVRRAVAPDTAWTEASPWDDRVAQAVFVGPDGDDAMPAGYSIRARAQAPAEADEPPPAPVAELPNVDAPSYSTRPRPDDVAVIVGIESYPHGLPRADYAERDARAVRAHVLALGYPERNVILLTGEEASRAGLVKNLERRLPELVKEDSNVFVYYSGHGAPDPSTGKAYLLPFDGDPAYLEDTGYSVERLYRKLGELKAKRVLVALDSCFSGSGGRSVLPKGLRPLVTKIDEGAVPSNVAALTASSGIQVSGALDEASHGAFTYYFLAGLNGAAADKSGRVTLSSLYGYLSPKVADEARRQNREQEPQLFAADGGGFVLR